MNIDTETHITTAEFAELAGISSADTVKKYCQRGLIKAINRFNRWMIPLSEVDKFKKSERKPGPKPKS